MVPLDPRGTCHDAALSDSQPEALPPSGHARIRTQLSHVARIGLCQGKFQKTGFFSGRRSVYDRLGQTGRCRSAGLFIV